MTTKTATLAAVLSVGSFIVPGIWAQAPLINPAAAPATQQISPEDEAEARIELGERFSDIAMAINHAERPSDASLAASCAILEAAAKMNPLEPRYLRLLAMERERAGDVPGAIKAWNRYRAIPEVKDDRVAAAEVIELYLSQIQANDGKIAYIRELLAKPTLDDQVKAHIAAIGVRLLDQRSRAEALVMLGEARKFYPLPEVTLLELAMLPRGCNDGAAFRRAVERRSGQSHQRGGRRRDRRHARRGGPVRAGADVVRDSNRSSQCQRNQRGAVFDRELSCRALSSR